MNRRKVLEFSLGPLLGAALSFITIPCIAWFFSPADVGRNNVFQVFISFSILLFVLGLDQAYVREFHESDNRFRLFQNCVVPGLLLLLVAFIASLPFAGWISSLLFGESKPGWYVVTASCVILSFLNRFLSLIVRMQERGLAYSLSQISSKLVVIFMLGSFVIFDAEPTYSNLLLANLVAILFAAIAFGWNTRAEWIPAFSAKMDFQELNRLLRFGAPLIGAGLAYWGLSATSTVALRTLSNFTELGLYSMAMSLAGAATIFQTIFTTVWMPTVYKWVAEKQDLRKIEVVREYVLAAVCFILAFTGIISSVVDLVLPKDYGQIKSIIVCCMAQPLLYTLSETTAVGLNVQRKTIYALGVAVLALLANLALSFSLVPYFGARGAAAANALAYTVFFVARTELSSIGWMRIKRANLYPIIISLILIATLNALIEKEYVLTHSEVWLVVFAYLFVHFRRIFWKHVSLLRRKKRVGNDVKEG